MMELLYLIVGVVIGTVLSYLFLKMRSKEELSSASAITMSAEKETAVLLQQVDDVES
jgi:uncharacterized membrane protein YgaE (UPF0421/DUF939 family)